MPDPFQWCPQTKPQEVSPQHEEELSMEGGRALQQLPMESWESSFLETPGHSPVSPALGDPAWTRGVGLVDL